MRVLISGDRKWADCDYVYRMIKLFQPTVIIEGEAPGADTCGRKAGERLNIPVLKFPANWKKFGNSAGPIRNRQMLREGKPDMVLAFHSDIKHSRGTKDMIKATRAAGVDYSLFDGTAILGEF